MKSKKILGIIILVMLLIGITAGNVFALGDCSVSLESNKREYTKNDEVTVSAKISNINSKNGVIAFGGTLEYDKNSLELLGMEGKNGWQVSNSNSGKLIADRNTPTKDSETILEIRFRVKVEENPNVNIELNNISIADGDLPMKEIPKVNTNIVIKEVTTTPDTKPNVKPDNKPSETPSTKPDNKPSDKPSTRPDNKPNEKPHTKPDEKPENKPAIDINTNTNSNSNSVNNTINNKVNNNNKKNTTVDGTISKTELPKTGNNIYTYLIIAMIVLIALSTVFYIKYKKVGKKPRK